MGEIILVAAVQMTSRDDVAANLERASVLAFLNDQSALIKKRLDAGEKVAMPAKIPAGIEPERYAAFAGFCHVLLNSNEFLYVN